MPNPSSSPTVLVLSQEDMRLVELTKDRMRDQCRKNIARINHLCAYKGESLSDHKECFDASKEFLRYGFFPGNYNDPEDMTTFDPSETIN